MKLEEIEAMVQAATNGHNWAMAFEPDKHIVIGEDIQGGKCVVVIPNDGGYKQELQRDKARLIAAAPTIIKDLLARNEELQRRVEHAYREGWSDGFDEGSYRCCESTFHRDGNHYWNKSEAKEFLTTLDAKEQDDD